MTDREMLRLCLRAFEAVPIARTARKVLCDICGKDAPAYAGNRSHVLAAEMARRLKEHLDAGAC